MAAIWSYHIYQVAFKVRPRERDLGKLGPISSKKSKSNITHKLITNRVGIIIFRLQAVSGNGTLWPALCFCGTMSHFFFIRNLYKEIQMQTTRHEKSLHNLPLHLHVLLLNVKFETMHWSKCFKSHS